jgi:hypothetical protein
MGGSGSGEGAGSGSDSDLEIEEEDGTSHGAGAGVAAGGSARQSGSAPQVPFLIQAPRALILSVPGRSGALQCGRLCSYGVAWSAGNSGTAWKGQAILRYRRY